MTDQNPAASAATPDPKTLEFLDLLIKAMTGVAIQDIPEEKRKEVVEKCIKIFSDYIINYVEIKFGKKDAVRLRAAQNTNEDMFAKFEDLGEKFDEAYHSFLDNLEKSWEKQIAEMKAKEEGGETPAVEAAPEAPAEMPAA